MPIAGKALLEHILFRLTHLQHPATVVVATSTERTDEPVVQFCANRGCEVFLGSELDVLERYYLCARRYGFDQIVRLTADNPFYDIAELDNLITLHLRERCDFSHSFSALPVGVGSEIFSFDALEASYQEGNEPHHREHVDEFLLEHPERFKTCQMEVPAGKRHPQVRLTVDTMQDYFRVCCIAEQAESDFVITEEAVELCSRCA